MDWKNSSSNNEGALKIPKRWLRLHYYEALNILFRFENSLRVFVYAILKNEFLEKWKACTFAVGEGEQKSISGIANQRIRQADNFGYLGFDITAPLMHLTSGELVELIVSEAYWPKFKRYFRGNKEIIKNKLLEIGSVRNSLAHFRPIKPDDIEVVKQNSRHTLMGVESCLSSLFVQNLRVPTNTTEDWYTSVSTLGTEVISTVPYYSENEEWTCIVWKFTSPILQKNGISDNFYSYMMGKLNTAHLLTNFPILAKYITHLSENLNYPSVGKGYDLVIVKDIRFVFRKSILLERHVEIVGELRKAIALITEECDLLKQDSLARGALVEVARATAYYSKTEGKEGKWNFSYDALEQPYLSNHPDEYWGQHIDTTDAVAGCPRYPWMPADISGRESWLD